MTKVQIIYDDDQPEKGVVVFGFPKCFVCFMWLYLYNFIYMNALVNIRKCQTWIFHNLSDSMDIFGTSGLNIKLGQI